MEVNWPVFVAVWTSRSGFVFPRFEAIRSLVISSPEVGGRKVKVTNIGKLSALHNLEHLSLPCYIDAAELAEISRLPHVKELRICYSDNGKREHGLAQLERMPALLRLDLCAKSLPTGSVLPLLAHISGLQDLCLDLPGPQENTGIGCLSALSSLRSLTLSAVSSTDLMSLVELYGAWKVLKSAFYGLPM